MIWLVDRANIINGTDDGMKIEKKGLGSGLKETMTWPIQRELLTIRDERKKDKR